MARARLDRELSSYVDALCYGSLTVAGVMNPNDAKTRAERGLDQEQGEVPLALAETALVSPATIDPAEAPERRTLTAREAPALRVEGEPTSLAPTPTPTPPGLPPLPPTLLDRYQILSLLGRGGMGAVYRAHDSQLNRSVALKFLLGDDPAQAERLLREARAQARVDHENICKVYEAGVDGGTCYIAMQLIDGAPLDRAKATMNVEAIVGVIREVASALHEAHRIGLIHRDVKPSNVLVTKAEDGSFHPYVVDFGIAREVGEQGQTMTGAIAGTPAFMAPEQARGEVRSLDRRTDVYSLGATLYDLLAGRPPFEGANVLELLQHIMHDEAPLIRRVKPSVPLDVEAILVKCLEKDPAQRYPSAKALADDLQRFLDGDPVEARRLSWARVLARKVRKNKRLTALTGALFITALLVTGYVVRVRRLAAEQAAIARDVGEDVKEMELFMRTAYALPLHDVERERDVVRARLQSIEARARATQGTNAGPLFYALGRGHLALREIDEAITRLEQASRAGYSSAELDYAMGLALAARYEKALEEAKKIDNPARRSARIEALKIEYGDRLLSHLKKARGARVESPAYVEGLIALYEGKPEDALASAQKAFEERPWLYEAKKLEGDACYAAGSRFKHDRAFDRDKMVASFARAAAAYERASAIASSDPSVYEVVCDLHIQIMNASTSDADALRRSFDAAQAACGKAITASSKGHGAALKLAQANASYAWLASTGVLKEDPKEAIARAIKRAEEVLAKSPGEPMAYYSMAHAARAEAYYLANKGLDDRPAVDRAIAYYDYALAIDPSLLWALNDASVALSIRAWSEGLRGGDPFPWFDRAIERSWRAQVIDPELVYGYSTEVIIRLGKAEHLVDVGRDPGETLVALRRAAETAAKLSPDLPLVGYWRAYALWIEARHELDKGGDPSAIIARGITAAEAQAKIAPASPEPHEAMGKLRLVEAAGLAARGVDPTPAVEEARAAFRRALAITPWDVGYQVRRAEVELIHLRWDVRRRAARIEAFDAAEAILAPLLREEKVFPRLYRVMAEILSLKATWLGEDKSALAAVEQGLSMTQKALGINRRMPRALLVKGALLAAKLRLTRQRSEEEELARGAIEALSTSMRENPLLAREAEPLRREVEQRAAKR